MTAAERLREWERLRSERDQLQRQMDALARPLERQAAALTNLGHYARLVGRDHDGRVRFTVRGGRRTFPLDALY